ncbi:MAG TPA: amidohydrolase family protein [Phycisphaerae bacterium]|nr:amidohydrolase family protein [Phycisphaerae bacterium]HOJ75504.1 amidohydrolase family protein [Phycisphaerae bacterium]HOM52860.1 amidohydrolase family protein [Phycisphaerae bacterium]HON65604.1 amidohydrolase family protein [Phycisphaerae bacterium]HOQ86885.1 amidohydrolase family protein [Phycisphaerae bacterium]
MIVDCHTHIWESVEQLGRGTGLWNTNARGGVPLVQRKANPETHQLASKPVDITFVLAFKSHFLNAHVPNEYVARYVKRYPNRVIGFASVDPSRPQEAIDDLRRAHGELGLKGLSVWPAAQDFHPACSAAMRVYTEAQRLRMPILFHQDVRASSVSKMEFARPYLLDEVAREFPELKIIISQIGYPWTEETIALLGKHKNVFADVSGLVQQSWHMYNALVQAFQAGVMDALLFGSDFPYSTAAESIEALYSINQFCHGTNLPTIPREQLRRIVERDSLTLLGIEDAEPPLVREPETTVIQLDD